MEENIKIMDCADVNQQFFNGKISYQTLLYQARMGYLPSIKIGRRVFFEYHTLVKFFKEKTESRCVAKTPQISIEKNLVEVTGIRRIV